MAPLAPLVRLRWLAVLLQFGLVVMGTALPGEAMAPAYALGLVAVGAVSNAGLQKISRDAPLGGWVTGGVLLFDLVLLTGLLAAAQGSWNPFTALYMVVVAIAASVLTEAATAAIVVAAALGYGSLFLFNTNPHAHHGAMGAHLMGMWVAFAVSAPFVAFTITTMRRALHNERIRANRAERLGSLATLAAGAAHELATPLATIQMAAAELARSARDDQLEDVALVRQQVRHCDEILKKLSVDAGHPAGPPPALVRLDTLVTMSCHRLDYGLDVVVDLAGLEATEVFVPAETVARALLGVIHNGLDASPHDRPVTIRARLEGDGIHLEFHNEGAPINDETMARIGEPFFTTKGHEGMGLGVFFAQSVLAQVGGTFALRNHTSGTIAEVGLPLATATAAADS